MQKGNFDYSIYKYDNRSYNAKYQNNNPSSSYKDKIYQINLLDPFQLDFTKLPITLFLLEQIDKTLFLDMSKDIQSFYHFYFENMSEPQIQDRILKRFCYFRIMTMIKDIMFKKISNNFSISLFEVRRNFENTFNNKSKITWNRNLNSKDYVSQLRMKLKFLYNTKNNFNNSIEMIQMINSQINDTIGDNSVHSIYSLLNDVYIKLLMFMSAKKIIFMYEDFRYGLDITMILLYLVSFIKKQIFIDLDGIYRKEKQRLLYIDLNSVSLLLILIGYKNLDLVHKVLSFFNVSNNNDVFENNDILKSYVLMKSL
jgi:hypothetical protein